MYVCVCREVDGGVGGCAVWECTSGARDGAGGGARDGAGGGGGASGAGGAGDVGSKGICVGMETVTMRL